MIDLTDRHLSTQQVARWFDYDHLSGPPRYSARLFHDLAEVLLSEIDDGPELTAGLRKLLEAKDCAVRAAIDTRRFVIDGEVVRASGSRMAPA